MLDLEAALGDVLLRGDPTVPAAPSTVQAVLELGRGSDLPLEELRRYAFADPAVAAELLGAANAVDAAAPVVSLADAEARLGDRAFVRILRRVARRGADVDPGPLARARRRTWRIAVVSAMLCRELARERGLPPEEAYACGLLHDVGRLVALAAFERLAAGTHAAPDAPLGRWERLAERWHVALGVAVADRLRLPAPVVEAIAFHHADAEELESPPPLLRIIRSVDALVAVMVHGLDSEDALEGVDLTDEEAARLSRAVERMEDHVAQLELRRSPAPAGGPAGDARAAGPALHERKGEGVRLRLAGREYAAVGFAPHQLLVSGPAPLGEGALLEVEVLDRRQPPFHVRVLTAWADGPRFGAILLPMGLSGPSLAELGGVLPAGASA